ncbi:chorismate synthase [Candidatus Peregrinibacteria bacterium]|nr:chorismate synthase [Candidatus Peregrinibacteria bacterium]
MAGNTIGTLFRVTTWGESHGPALGVVIDGCPARLQLCENDVQAELDRRRPGQSEVGTARKEKDSVKILSGVFESMTTGTPISMAVFNDDQRSHDYDSIKKLYRPGHADYTYEQKYGIRDYRGGGRSSGRETVARVMAGAVAKKYLLEKTSIRIIGHSKQVGEIVAENFDESHIEKNPLRSADPSLSKKKEEYVLKAKNEGDSVGGVAEFIIKNVPAGLGEPVFDKLEADLGKALLSIGTVKGVEFGSGFMSALKRGSENNDQFVSEKGFVTVASNDAGGILGGISSGHDIIVRVASKPASSILKEQNTVTKDGDPTKISVKGRHDAFILPRLIPVAEAMIAITLMDHYLRHNAPHS